jgi:hypothetical protein
VRVVDRLRGFGDPAFSPGRGSRRHVGGPARLEGVMAPSSSSFDSILPAAGKDGRRRRVRPPWRRGGRPRRLRWHCTRTVRSCCRSLEDDRPSLLVRQGKGGKPRRQPLPSQLVTELERWRREREPSPTDPVFCGLAGGRLQANVLADVIRRTVRGAYPVKNPATSTIEKPRRSGAFP